MWEDDEIFAEELNSGLNFTKMQIALKSKISYLKIAIENNKQSDIQKCIGEIDNILEWYC